MNFLLSCPLPVHSLSTPCLPPVCRLIAMDAQWMLNGCSMDAEYMLIIYSASSRLSVLINEDWFSEIDCKGTTNFPYMQIFLTFLCKTWFFLSFSFNSFNSPTNKNLRNLWTINFWLILGPFGLTLSLRLSALYLCLSLWKPSKV